MKNKVNTIIYTLLFIMPFFYLRKMAEPALGARWILLNIISLALPSLAFWQFAATKRNLNLKFNYLHITLLVIMLYTLVTGLWSIDIASFTENSINYFSVLLLIMFFSFYSEKLDFNKIFQILFVVVSLISLLGLLQYSGFAKGLYGQTAPPAAGFVNKNLATATVILLFPTTYLKLLLQKSSRFKNIIYLAGFTVSLTYIIAASTRSSWLGGIFSFFIMIIYIYSFRQKLASNLSWKRITLVICGIIIAFLFLKIHDQLEIDSGMNRSYDQQLDSLLEYAKNTDESKKGSISSRLIKWQNSLEIFKSHPLQGIGAGNFDAYYPISHKSITEDKFYKRTLFWGGLHNEPLQTLIELGIIGFLLIAVFFIFLFLSLVKIIKVLPIEFAIVYLAMMGGISAILIDSLFNPTFHFPTTLLFFSLFTGAIIGKTQQIIFLKTFNFKLAKSGNLIIPILVIFTLLITLVGVKKYQSNMLHRKALSYDKAYRMKEASFFSSKAGKTWPSQNMYAFHAARINGRYYLKYGQIKDYRTAKKLLGKALKNMPNNYLLNYINFKLALKSRSKSHLAEVENDIQLLLDVTPFEALYDSYDTIRIFYETVGNPKMELEFFIKANQHAGNAYYDNLEYIKALKYYRRLKERVELDFELQKRVQELELKFAE